MTLNITTEVPFTPVRLIVSAGVRYWEDATVNGIQDIDGSLIPMRSHELWRPAVELATGRVIDWPHGTTASVHYKVCDAGEYWLENADGKRVKYKGDYVPRLLSVGDDGFGDYIILKISADGMIQGWKEPQLDDEDWKLE